MPSDSSQPRVFLVGAGPGSPGLLTVRAAEVLARADLVVHELLTHRLYVYLRRDWKLRAAAAEPFVLGRVTYRTRDLAIDLFEGSLN